MSLMSSMSGSLSNLSIDIGFNIGGPTRHMAEQKSLKASYYVVLALNSYSKLMRLK
jgi:hypothetical protein